MKLLDVSRSGYTYIGDDNNYYVAIYNHDCGAPDEVYPLELVRSEYIIGSDECPF